MKDTFCAATAFHGSTALSFVIPSAAEGSAVPRTFLGNVFRRSEAESRPCLPRLAVEEKSNGDLQFSGLVLEILVPLGRFIPCGSATPVCASEFPPANESQVTEVAALIDCWHRNRVAILQRCRGRS